MSKSLTQRLAQIDRDIETLSRKMVGLHLERDEVLQGLIRETQERLQELQGQTTPTPVASTERKPYTGRKRGVPKGTPNMLQRKLTNDDVRAIRASFAAGELSQREIGERYAVPQATISKIVRRLSYVDVPDDPAEDPAA